MDKPRTWVLLTVLVVFLLVVNSNLVLTQDDAEWIEVRENARQLLLSPDAALLSGSALTAAQHLAGTSVLNSSLNPLASGNAHVVLPFKSNRFQIMVNDPSQDQFESGDISTQSETAVAGFGGTIVVTFNDSAEFTLFPTFMGYSRSSDGGASFTDMGKVPPFVLPPNLQLNGGDPAVVADRAGNFYTAHLTPSIINAGRPAGFTNAIGVNKSTDGGQTWGPTIYPAAPGGVKANSQQDKELLAVDISGGTCNGNVYVTWTSFGGTAFPPPDSPNPPILISRSTNGGASFSVPLKISPFAWSNQGSEPAVGPNGEVYVAWFRINGPSPGPGQPPLGPAIVVAKSTNCGATFGPTVEVANITPIGFGGQPVNARLRGNFRTNSYPRIDVNPLNGHVYIVYNANPDGPDGSDIFFTRSTNGGATWSSPIRVNSDPGDNDQFFPDLAVNAAGAIEVAWYDQRLDPQNLAMDIYHARSVDGGLSFGPNQRVTMASSVPAVGYDPVVNSNYIGDYIDLKVNTTSSGPGYDFLLSWGDFRRVIQTDGGVRPDQDVFFAFLK